MNFKEMFKSKTFWTGIGMIGSGASGYFVGEVGIGAALQTVLTGLAFIFLRDSMVK